MEEDSVWLLFFFVSTELLILNFSVSEMHSKRSTDNQPPLEMNTVPGSSTEAKDSQCVIKIHEASITHKTLTQNGQYKRKTIDWHLVHAVAALQRFAFLECASEHSF